MSAIAGILNLDGRPADPAALQRMLAVVAHRGPDGAGSWSDGPLALGNLQLHTTPEASRETLPAIDSTERLVLVYDGRLDNRDELIDALRHRGRLTRGSTDSEILLQAYAEWGSDFACKLVGDYAMALWDGQRRQLVCVRDPIGAKPLFYFTDGLRVAFATEIKQLFQLPGIPRRLNDEMLGVFLCGNFADPEATFYQGISRLPGGSTLIASGRGVLVRRFWDPDPADEIRYEKLADYHEDFRDRFFKAVRARLRASSRVGIMLSGGLDSGTVASVAGVLYERQDLRPSVDRPKAFFKTYRNPPFDESPYMRAVFERYGLELKTISVDDTWAMQDSPVFRRFDEPVASPFESMQCLGLETARNDGVRVLLTGEGGDEAFHWGYMPYLRDWLLRLRFKSLIEDFFGGTPTYRRLMLWYLRRHLVPRSFSRLFARDRIAVPPWITPGFVAETHLRRHLQRLAKLSYRDSDYSQSRGMNPLLMSSDIRSAWYGIEMRHPFWDSRIVEFFTRIPPTVRVQGGRSKLFLKKAMAGIVPGSVLGRTPYGAFGRQMDGGFKQREADRIERALDDSYLARIGAVDPRIVGAVFRSYRNGDNAKFGKLYWTLIAEDWLRKVSPELAGVGQAHAPQAEAQAIAGSG
ncbi:MAG: asparagine synthase (glutamine-hydrolyzing) [Chloroflexi bacterium]|nr:asparagine synthase (glutamine-hydrolyzing) [Chloroflexota bacterium]